MYERQGRKDELADEGPDRGVGPFATVMETARPYYSAGCLYSRVLYKV